MTFIKKKNLLEGEDLLYNPQLHWAYIIRPLLQILPIAIILLILWFCTEPIYAVLGFSVEGAFLHLVVRNVLLTAALVILLLLLWRILQYLNTEYGVTSKRLIIKKGVFRIFISEIPTDRIESIYCVQGLLGRLFHYGTICISGVGGMMPMFYMVCRPYGLRRKIMEIVEKNKVVTVTHDNAPGLGKEPIYRYGTFVRILTGSEKQKS